MHVAMHVSSLSKKSMMREHMMSDSILANSKVALSLWYTSRLAFKHMQGTALEQHSDHGELGHCRHQILSLHHLLKGLEELNPSVRQSMAEVWDINGIHLTHHFVRVALEVCLEVFTLLEGPCLLKLQRQATGGGG